MTVYRPNERKKMADFEKARILLRQFKGDSYLFGAGVLSGVGQIVAAAGRKAALVRDTFHGGDSFVRVITDSLSKSGAELAAEIKGARPNCFSLASLSFTRVSTPMTSPKTLR